MKFKCPFRQSINPPKEQISTSSFAHFLYRLNWIIYPKKISRVHTILRLDGKVGFVYGYKSLSKLPC